jgi:subtilisin-like proprotein convertase family protein
MTASYTNSTLTVIPDGNPVGAVEQFTVGGVGGSVINVTVQLDITGGFNGDLYAYLVDPQGQMAVLLNRSGVDGGNPFGCSARGSTSR